VDKTSGQLPLSVTAKVEAKDREGDALTYIWNLGNGETQETKDPEVSYTYKDAGNYKISVTVRDDKGEAANSEVTSVVAGNSRPEVAIDLNGGNSSFFLKGVPINYSVTAKDPDGADIDPDNLFVSVDYLESYDKQNQSLGHQQVSAAVTGKALTQGMDCKTCHKEEEASIGPNYFDIAMKYKDKPEASGYLQNKIIAGGGGVWGEVVMPAHPDVSKEETRQIVEYIMSLANDSGKEKSMPASGTIRPNPKQGDNVLVLTASYTDEGAEGTIPLTGVTSVALQGSTVSFSDKTKADGFTAVQFDGQDLLIIPNSEGWFALEDVDLTGVKAAILTAGWQEAPKTGLEFEMHLNAPDGELLGKGSMPKPEGGQPGGRIAIELETEKEVKADEIYFVYKPKEGEERGGSPVALTNVRFEAK